MFRQIPEDALDITPDKPIVKNMKFCLSGFTALQLILMWFQFKIKTAIIREEERLDLNMIERGASDASPLDGTGPQLIFGFDMSSFRQCSFVVELLLCAVHPAPYVKKKFLMMVVGRASIYCLESWVNPLSPIFSRQIPRYLPHCALLLVLEQIPLIFLTVSPSLNTIPPPFHTHKPTSTHATALARGARPLLPLLAPLEGANLVCSYSITRPHTSGHALLDRRVPARNPFQAIFHSSVHIYWKLACVCVCVCVRACVCACVRVCVCMWFR